MGDVTVGIVVARTGRLTQVGEALDFATEIARPKMNRIKNGTRSFDCKVLSRDSASQPSQARAVTKDLIVRDGARLVITLGGSQVLPAVAETCEELGIPCVSSAFPWQAYYYGRGATDDHPFRWTYHFCWGLDDIARVFAEMWRLAGEDRKIGCLWNDSVQGRWLRNSTIGFLPAATSLGYTTVDPGGYAEPATDFSDELSEFGHEDVRVVTSAATVADLALFREQAKERGLCPRLITCSRWLLYPSSSSGADAVATFVYWTPWHPYRSSLDGMSAAELADTFETVTGRQWLQPLGLAYALFEVAAHALATADDPNAPEAVADALSHTTLETIAGPLDWTRGPTPNVATIDLVGGQWKASDRFPHDLRVVTSSGHMELPIDDLQLLG